MLQSPANIRAFCLQVATTEAIVTSPPKWVGSITISVYVCPCVCLSVCSHVSKSTCTNFTKFAVNVTLVAVTQSSSSNDNANTLCTSGFADDVMFSHNGENQSDDVMFGRVNQMAAPVSGHAARLCLLRGRSLVSSIALFATVNVHIRVHLHHITLLLFIS